MSNAGYPESRIWSGHYYPVLVDFNFYVDSTQTLGIRSLKGAYVSQVYMASSASITGSLHANEIIDDIASTEGLVVGMTLSGAYLEPGTQITAIVSETSIEIDPPAMAAFPDEVIILAAVGSPNPGPGTIVVKLSDNYNRLLFLNAKGTGPLTGSNVAVNSTSLTLRQVYVITAVGTSTTADWVTLGVPLGVTPAVGVAFIANQTGAGSGTGQVQLPSYSNVSNFEVVGDVDTTCNPTLHPSTAVQGAWITLQGYSAGGAATVPDDGTLIEVQAWMSNSSLTLGGQ